MNGVHDMGGMHGFGGVDTDDADAFHHEWEELFHGTMRVLSVHGLFSSDESRHMRERLDPVEYLRAGYYEQRLLPTEWLLIEAGVLSEGEVDDRMQEDVQIPERTDPALVERVRENLATNSSFERDPKPPRFEPGESVLVRNDHPAGHTRCPRYVRQTQGTVEEHLGTVRFPDASAAGEDVGEPLYSVRFAARDVWGDDAQEPGTLVLQLWEPYLRELADEAH